MPTCRKLKGKPDTMVVLVNSLPKSGTNFLEEFLKINGVQHSGFSVSPTKYLGAQGYLTRLMPSYLFDRTIVDIGYEVAAPYPFREITRKLNRAALRDDNYVSSHISYNPEIEKWLFESKVKMVYVVRDPIDVLYSYVNYVLREPRHLFFEPARKISKSRLIETFVNGGPLGGYVIRSWKSVIASAGRWIEVAEGNDMIFVVRFEELIKAVNVENKCINRDLENFLGCKFEFGLRDAYGKGKTHFRAEAGRWVHDQEFCACLDPASRSALRAMLGY
jgi:Sulfotransferase domain